MNLEEYVKKLFVKCIDDTIDDIEKTKQNIISRVAKVLDSGIETKIKVIDIAMEDLQKAMMECYKERQSKEISEDEYKNRATSIATKINELKMKRKNLNKKMEQSN